ncbi:MAG: hypothetical protein PHC52_14525 [Syntrophales bacterium]|nr:hypothetical protein [Candidatus ainarchaeum sp.]MDD5096781.1 hypothetical protein [Candidatus ainarchaeum sp.]MDD5534004.1 hypothetical protein [Syntrophales bacterium]
MKGQVTAEYLLLVAVGISLLGISLAALSTIKGAEGTVYAREKARMVAGDLSSIASEVCALGDGNSRAYSMESAVLECTGNTISVSVGNETASAGVPGCGVECGGEHSGGISISNSHGTVIIG